MTAAQSKSPTKAEIKRAIAAARESNAVSIRLPKGIIIDLRTPVDEGGPEGFVFDHEDEDNDQAA